MDAAHLIPTVQAKSRTVRKATFADVDRVANNLSHESLRELQAVYGIDRFAPARLAYDALSRPNYELIVAVCRHDKAEYIGLVLKISTEHYALGGFGSVQTKRVARRMIDYVRAELIPELLARGAQTLGAGALEVNSGAQRLLELMGATPGEILAEPGEQGEAFRAWWWDRKGLERCATSANQ